MKKIIKKIPLIIFIAILLSPVMSMAQEPKYTLLEPLPCIPGTGNGTCADGKPITDISLNTYIGYIFKFAIALAAFLAVIMIIWGGFEVMLSESPFKIGAGKDRIYNAIWGLLGVLASYLILATIDPRLVQINTTIPPIVVCKEKGQKNCIDTSDVTKFQKELEENLNKNVSYLNVIDQKDMQDAYENIDKLEKQKEFLSSNYRNDPGSISRVEYDKEIEKINQDIKTNKSNIIKIDGVNKSINLFVDTINNKDNSTDAEAKKELSNIISENTKKLSTLQDFKAVQTLEKQEKFFTEEIDKQKILEERIDTYQKNKNVSGAGLFRGSLVIDRDAYQKEYSALTSSGTESNTITERIGGDVRIQSVYKNILEGRINVLNETLK